MPSRIRILVFFTLLACAAACIAVSTQSVWIDEAEVANITNHPTVQGAWAALYADHTSNMQLPLFFAYMWGWGRLFGLSELAIRAANLPWFFLGFFAIAHFLRSHPSLRNTTLLLYCLHPFVWFYVDEARPYEMQLSGALLVSGALFAALDQPDEVLPASWWWLLAAGFLILCGASVVGVPWAIGVVILLIRRRGFWQSLRRHGLPALILGLPIYTLLALYFAWTFKEQVRSAALPLTVPGSLSIFYEQLGFLGLGPGRAVLRIASVSALRPYLLPIFLLAIPLAWGLILAARRRFGLSTAHLTSIVLLIASCLCLILVVGFLHHARILARHLTPLFPFILLAEAYAILLLWKSGRVLNRAAAALIVIALAVSSLEVRFAFRHSKDDNRSAVATAKQALTEGETVWWAADIDSARYYHLPIDQRGGSNTARWVDQLPASFGSPPEQIYLCKPDLFDFTGSISRFIAAHHYFPAATWQNITLWQAPAP